jgi:cyclophilin family peptidyl-prolyl cis-trans isomerase
VRSANADVAIRAIPGCRDTSVAIRHVAYRMLGTANTEEATTVLLEGLEDPSFEVRSAAAEAFMMFTDTIRILRTFPYLETETDPRVLKSLISSIAEHWRPQAEPYLKKLLTHPDPGVRAAAVHGIAHRLDFQFSKRIAPAVVDPDPIVRLAYLETIDELGKFTTLDASGFISNILALTTDSVPRVRARAAQSYLTYGGDGWPDVLSRMYHDPDPYCLHMAISLIGGFRVQSYQDSLHALYQELRNDWRPDNKWAIIASSANLAPSVHADSVRSEIFNWGMSDPNRHVRWYSIAVWEKFRQDRRAELGTYKTDITVENVDELLHLYAANPTARVETTRGTFTLELLADKTPRYVRRFIELVNEGVYDDSPVNDVQVRGVVHLGDRRGDGFGMPGISVRDEFRPDRIETGDALWLINTRDAGMGLFAIALGPLPYLDWRYGVFAHVTEGLDVVRDLQLTDTLKTIRIVTPAS